MNQAAANGPVNYTHCKRSFSMFVLLLNASVCKFLHAAVLFCTHVSVKDCTSMLILDFIRSCPFSLWMWKEKVCPGFTWALVFLESLSICISVHTCTSLFKFGGIKPSTTVSCCLNIFCLEQLSKGSFCVQMGRIFGFLEVHYACPYSLGSMTSLSQCLANSV